MKLSGVLEFACSRPLFSGDATMKNPLDSLWGTVITGLVLTVILYYLVRSMMGVGP
jgi:hypothetical protein